ncbi:hypothetical protein TeGR_g8605 [Tetraparma gracilis]|uniref:Uncharacterized protein n=1 Tax=Tetraparma gracilis TaxID=2962635 RepID=A0ABQ6NAV7_9STRA|nr:hypothetical protein TeGR_g8605 [Tetraparma gracilis]
MKWYNDNFAIHTGGRYSLLLVIGAEVFELMVQATNANSMAGYVDWPALSFYGTLISVNCILFGICMLSDERFISESVVITVDVVMDASYIMFNIYVSNPVSYWAIIMPLFLSVDMLNDSMTDLVAAPEGLEMLNASFCDLDEITGGQAVKLQDHNMVLHGNPVTRLEWPYELELKKIPAWLQTLEKVAYANLGYCDVKEMKGGSFPASLEELIIENQGSEGLRLHPDSFEGLPNLLFLDMSTNNITEDDMHLGLFAGATSLSELYLYGNPEMRWFNATELFPGGSKTLGRLNLDNCGLKEGTSFQGLPYLKYLRLTADEISHMADTSYLALAEVRAFDSAGTLIAPSGVEMYSFGWGGIPENCIDGDLTNYCHVGGDDGKEYLRVDYATDVATLSTVEVTNRADCCQDRIVGAKVYVVMGRTGSNEQARESALWTGEFTSIHAAYTFTPAAASCPS